MKILLLTLLLFVSFTHAQTDLPVKGSVSDLKGKTKFYIIADAENEKLVRKGMGKQFTEVRQPSEAEFFVEYRILSTVTDPTGLYVYGLSTGELDVYYMKGPKEKTLCWSGVSREGFHKAPPQQMAEKFTNAYRKAQ